MKGRHKTSCTKYAVRTQYLELELLIKVAFLSNKLYLILDKNNKTIIKNDSENSRQTFKTMEILSHDNDFKIKIFY